MEVRSGLMVTTGQFCRARKPQPFDDIELIKRIVRAYQRAIETPIGTGALWDGPLFNLKKDVHAALTSGDVTVTGRLLRDPRKTDLFYGFDDLSQSLIALPMNEVQFASRLSGSLLRLAEATGVTNIYNPEAAEQPRPTIEYVLDALADRFGFRLDFPNPFEGEGGIATPTGVASDRAIHAIYQAFRIAELVAPGNKVLEIGAGLGRTAYYARMFGITDYTIVDLPMTAVAQAYFLGRILGPDAICLSGEDRPGIRILPPAAFLEGTEKYDLILNADSLTEMSLEVATSYCEAAKSRSNIFLSINHEANVFTARDVFLALETRAQTRSPYWMRPGYAEEVFRMG